MMSQSLKVPAGTLFREGDAWHVYRVVHDVVELCAVEIGETNGLETEITSGLSESDVVILHPTNTVRVGVRIRDND